MLLVLIFRNFIKIRFFFLLKFLSLYLKQILLQYKNQLYFSVTKGLGDYTIGTTEFFGLCPASGILRNTTFQNLGPIVSSDENIGRISALLGSLNHREPKSL